ncbi:hypothetical protein EI546_10430 [Aequorivita sp. H23M31]|uniref:DUF6973 domain-containing protein n=1 Tax=Aequorivita ciconiae TaxID=2494375 RepID=A0A410G4E6_9FLAO|nr:hypothetical protein [Aequorivita sp. H23M31]QAA82111.1 hypothetical protein EI546_10430 [Aequorivita sp. H23M31]
MKILSRIWDLEFSKIWRLVWIGIKHPFLVMPTNKATIQTMQICDRIYGDEHHGDGKANAFRHALWNILIAQRVLKIVKTEEKAISWTEEITSLHEVLMPNPPLEKEMDLHNNEMGRKYFPELEEASKEEIIHFLMKEIKNAVQIKKEGDTENFKDVMVYMDK